MNDLLRQHHAPIITIGTAKEIRLDSKARQKLEELLQEMNQSSQYYMNKKGTSDLYVSDAVYEQ